MVKAIMNNLYKDILMGIFSQLDISWRVMAREVCTNWRETLPAVPLVYNEIIINKGLSEWAASNRESDPALVWAAAIKNIGEDVMTWYAGYYFCGWDSRTFAAASGAGKLKIVKWLRLNGCEWDRRSPEEAARYGHLHIVKWLYEKNCPLDMQRVAEIAAESHEPDVVTWVWGNNFELNEKVMEAAVRGGDSLTVRTIFQFCHILNNELMYIAASNGDLELLSWLLVVKRCPVDGRSCSIAAFNGDLQVLQWLRNNGCPWDINTPIIAAKNNHLHILEWCYKNNCPMNDELTSYIKK
jgi:hypothetical protein